MEGDARPTVFARQPSSQVAPETVILRGCPSNYPSSRFEDDVWDLKGMIPRANIKTSITQIKFSSVDEHWRILAKEYLFARLNELGVRPRSIKAVSANSAFYPLRRFLIFVSMKGLTLPEVDQEDLDEYLRTLQGSGISPSSVERYVSAIQHLYRLRERLSADGLDVSPWDMRPSHLVAGVVAPTENLTPQIPEPVLGPILRMAVFYVQTASRDVLAVREEIRRLRATPIIKTADAAVALQRWLDERRQLGRGLPALSSRSAIRHRGGASAVNSKQCMLMAGITSTSPSRQMTEMIHRAAETVDLEVGGFNTGISVDPTTGRPWRSRFDLDSAAIETRMVIAACYIVIAYLSGMRDSEVQTLRRGCRDIQRGSDGTVIRHRLNGVVWKDRKPTGDSARWVVLPIVSDAVEVLEALGSGNYLFERPDHKRKAEVFGSVMPTVLNKFTAHVNILRPHDAVPLVNGVMWRLRSPQFRRTLAWHIANQPFGEVAGMIQYQQVRVTTFQGYAGVSDSGFRAEVEAEESARRERDILDMYDDFKEGVKATSAGGERLHRQFADIQQSAGDLPGRIIDERRRQVMLMAISVNFYAGIFNDCLLQEDVAVCLAESKSAKAPDGRRLLPILAVRNPCGACPNSSITVKHLPAWEAQRAGLEVRLDAPGLKDLQRATLREQLDDTTNVIGRFHS